MTPDLYAELSRRNIMALGASAGVGLGLGSISTPALAKAAKLRVQAPYWYRFNVGEAEITVVSDGSSPPTPPQRGAAPAVLTFVQEWRARQDSNLWPLPSEGSGVARPPLARDR